MKRALTAVLALAAGCSHPAPAPPPAPTASVASWTGSGNDGVEICNELQQTNCLLNYTLFDKTANKMIANIPIGQLKYTIDSIQPDAYELWVNLQIAPNVTVSGQAASATAAQSAQP